MTHKRRVANEILLSPEMVRGLFSYSADDGILRRLRSTGPTARAGSIAGRVYPSGYRGVIVKGHSYSAHRLAWCHFYGRWPALYIDHINGDRADNRLCNLREATHSQNLGNSKKHARTGDQPKGVTLLPSGKWRAQIAVDGRSRHIGLYATAEQAHQAYVAAAKKRFGTFARAA